MKIGIDAKWYFEGPVSGTKVVVEQLNNLLMLSNEHEFYVFLDSRARRDAFPIKKPNVHLVYVWGRINLLSNLLIVPFYAKRLKIDIVLFQYFGTMLFSFKKVCFIHDVIFASHPQYFSVIERAYFSPIKLLSRLSNRVCTVSYSEKQRIVSRGFQKSDLVEVTWNGVGDEYKPLELHAPEEVRDVELALSLRKPFVLYVGRVDRRKNIPNLIRAMDRVGNKDVSLVVTGAVRTWDPDISVAVDSLADRSRVIFTGYVAERLLPALFSLASVFAYVSYQEGFGLPVLEAMASGVPVIVSDIPVFREICEEAGNYVDPDNPNDIARMIDRLVNDLDYSKKKRLLGISRAQMFSWRDSASRLLRILENC